MSSGVLWYEAADASGPWQLTSSPPADLVAMLPEPEGDTTAPASAPEIVVATEATELVVSDGKPNWSALGDGNVLYVTNTDAVVAGSANGQYVSVAVGALVPGQNRRWPLDFCARR